MKITISSKPEKWLDWGEVEHRLSQLTTEHLLLVHERSETLAEFVTSEMAERLNQPPR